MRIKAWDELVPLNLLIVLLIVAVIFFPDNILWIIIGLPFLLFFPGYVLTTALFPRRESIRGVERLALSFGMSIVIVPLIGLILNYTPWGIRSESVLCSMASFIFIMSAIAWVRRKKLPEEERFSVKFRLALPGRGGTAWDKALSAILVLTILGALGTVGYVIAAPKEGEKFTEFYILGMEGRTADYPVQLEVGEEGKVVVGIINHEYREVSYRIELRINGAETNEIGPMVLQHDEKWEQEAGFVPEVAGKNRKVEFWLYKDGEVEPYLEPLRLWIDVTE